MSAEYRHIWYQNHKDRYYDTCACGNSKTKRANKCAACRFNLPTPRVMEKSEIAWVAGILEGEGCWSGSPERWWVSVRMTDEDIIRRLQQITSVGRITLDPKPSQNPLHKPCWAWTVAAKQHREHITKLVYPWMGSRRQKKILELWSEVPQ